MRFKAIFHLILTSLAAAGTVGFNYSNIDWKTVETPHFVIHYYEDVSWTARKVAAIAEEIYPKVTEIYKHEPSRKTNIVVRDDEDTSNGFAVYSLGYLTIWASPSTLSLRGRHDWVREVLTHEFSHIVSLQTSSPAGWLVEGVRFGGVWNADTNANTDLGVTLFIPTHPYSRWWAEGTAQFDTYNLGHDFWDSNRDMLLRSATLENNLLTFDQMRNITVREHFGGEMVYNQGFAFLRWLKETKGDDANFKIAEESASFWNLDFDRNIEKALGVSARFLDAQWRTYLQQYYESEVSEVRKLPKQGEAIPLLSQKEIDREDPSDRPYSDGLYNAYPRFSPDGRWFSWVEGSNIKFRYLDSPYVLPKLEEDDKDKSKPVPLTLSAGGRFYSWAPDSRRIIVAKRQSNHWNGYPYYDLYSIDMSRVSDLRAIYLVQFRRAASDSERKAATNAYQSNGEAMRIKPKRLTHGLRATHVTWSPDGKTIAFVQTKDGHRDLKLSDPDGTNVRDLVAIGGDAEALDPAWSPDGTQIVFTLYNHEQGDIWLANISGGRPIPLTLDLADDRDPAWSPDGKSILFASDRSGIFQIYRLPSGANPEVKPELITEVETGAFMPFVPKEADQMFYVRFSSFGFKPYQMALAPFKTAEQPPVDSTSWGEKAIHQLTPEESYPEINGESYFPKPRPIRLFPSVIWENDKMKAGIAGEVSDYLEKHTLSGVALFGSEQDYQISYSNQMFYPRFTASYTEYIRYDSLFFVNNGNGIVDEPEGLVRDDIQFIDAGFSQDFRTEGWLEGSHLLTLFYNRRYVDRRIGFPIIINNQIENAFRYITNDGLSLEWNFRHVPSLLPKDFDINPQDATYFSLGYGLVHTSLFTADPTIPGPNKNYWYNEGTLTFEHYHAMKWNQPGWKHHTLWFKFNGGMKSRDVSNLDEFFLGGRINFRAFGQIASNTFFYGYEDFSISGETMLLFSTGYTFPLLRSIDKKWGVLLLDSLYGGFFGEAGNAWSFGETKNLNQNPTHNPKLDEGEVLLGDIGAELKFKAFAFNDFNSWNSLIRIAYGFQDQAKYGFSDDDSPIRIYIGVGTDF